MFYCCGNYCGLWVFSLWIALFGTIARVTIDCEYFHYRLWVLLLWIALFASSLCHALSKGMGVDTNTLHCGRHYSHRLFYYGQHYRALRGVFLCCVFRQELQVEALPTLPKAIRSSLAAGPNGVGCGYQARPKTHLKWATTLDPATQQHPIVLGMAEPHPKTLQKEVGFGCAAISKDIIIYIINIFIFLLLILKYYYLYYKWYLFLL